MPAQPDAATFPQRFTGKTVLVTGAGAGFGAEIAVCAAQEGARVWCKGTLLCTQEFGSRMVEAGGGCVVNIGSTVIVRGSARRRSTPRPSTRTTEIGVLNEGVVRMGREVAVPTLRHQAVVALIHRLERSWSAPR
jgi:3-oxoacyl-[acyl-carrier protein] reductase